VALPAATKEDVVKAMSEFDTRMRNADEWIGWEGRDSHKWALSYGGRQYPVKQIISLATGSPVSDFSGGPESNEYLEARGLSVVPIARSVDGSGQTAAPQIFVFTAGNASARDHLRDSIDRPIPRDLCERYVDPGELSELRAATGDGDNLYAWGAVPGPQNSPRWEKLRPGDYVLTVSQLRYIRLARVVKTLRNPDFSRALWAGDYEGSTWELMYFLTTPQRTDRATADLATLLPSRYQGFSRISDEKVAAINARYGSVEVFVSQEFGAGSHMVEDHLSLRIAFEEILRDYPQARQTGTFGGDHPVVQVFQRVEQAIAVLPAVRANAHLRVKFSAGLGNWARVPWIAVMDERETTSTQKGIDIVYLFREDGSGVYLSLNQGVTDPIRQLGRRKGIQLVRERSANLRPHLQRLEGAGFKLDDGIDLRATPGLGQDYEASTIAYRLYEVGSVPDDRQIERDLVQLLEAYAEVLTVAKPIEAMDLGELVAAFSSAIRAANVVFGASHDEVIRRFLASVLTKPLVILTGLSGSGKTQIALKFGEWLGVEHMAIIPVRPDWTGPESLFGYEDVLRPRINGHAAWAVPESLEFFLRASRDPDRLYVLILDEMNLAHVERYFADFLSGMESGKEVLPNLVHLDGQWLVIPEGPPLLPIPRNIVVIGTVNVDETTYMFSPKVLDRANTLEFRVATADLASNPARPLPIAPAPPTALAALVTTARDDSFQLTSPNVPPVEFSQRLRQVHEILSRHDAEFGFRTFYDSIRFAALYRALGEDDWQRALDVQVLQKVLPRLHGSRRKLESVLQSIGGFAFDFSEPTAVPFDVLASRDQAAVLPGSFAKLQRMMRSLQMNQFASFTD
jgi:5-methylcytosine-specific restriction enzyme B